MPFHDPEKMSQDEIKANNLATFQQMVNIKLEEVPDLMQLPIDLYSYPFPGTTHEARRKELLEHLTPLVEAVGIDHFMRIPIMVSIACLFSAAHREEASSLAEMLNSVQMLFMTLYGSPDTSGVAVTAFSQMMESFNEMMAEVAEQDEGDMVPMGHSIH